MSIAAQLIVNGLIAGAIYALVASGFSLIYSTCKFIHFAHGAAVMLAAYLLYLLFSVLGIPIAGAVFLSVAGSVLIGYLMNLLVYRQLRKRKASSVILLIASVALLILLESVVVIIFGANVKTINALPLQQGVHLLGAIITPLQIVIVISALVLLALLYVFMNKTRIGKAMRAVADNKDVAEICGISSERIYSISIMMGSGIAGIAGILVSLEQNLEPIMGTHLIIKGFTGAIIGGIHSVPGAVLGSFLLGLTENIGIWFLPSGYKDAIAFVILLGFLLMKPQGIIGTKRGEGK